MLFFLQLSQCASKNESNLPSSDGLLNHLVLQLMLLKIESKPSSPKSDLRNRVSKLKFVISDTESDCRMHAGRIGTICRVAWGRKLNRMLGFGAEKKSPLWDLYMPACSTWTHRDRRSGLAGYGD